MSWKTTCPMSERVRFIGMHEAGGRTVSGLCREFGISRKTAYKWLGRFQEEGADGLKERSRAPHSCPHALDEATRRKLIEARRMHRTWGPRKLLAWLKRQDEDQEWPAASTLGDLLKREGLVHPRRRRRPVDAVSRPADHTEGPNELWCADFKGQFRTGNGTLCYPLTISDPYSRYLLRCEALTSTGWRSAHRVFDRTFSRYGLPRAIRTDNGSPFASSGLGRLSHLSVWWIKLGIRPERIELGHPEQNGRHERMHRTLKRETALPAARTLKAQQARFDRFRQVYNEQRPHEALNERVPAELYRQSERRYPCSIPATEYPAHYEVRRVSAAGAMKWRNTAVYVNECLEREDVGLVEIEQDLWRVYFMSYEIGLLYERSTRVMPTLPRVR